MFLITERLINLREQMGFTQKEVAGLLKISRSTYSNYENNNREPSLEILSSIAKLYHVPLSYLLGDTALVYDEQTQQYIVDKTLLSSLSGDEITLLDHFRALDLISKNEALKFVKSLRTKL